MTFASKVVFLLVLLSALALCPEASSKGTTVTERILQGFQDVTSMSDDLRIATQNINAFNAPREGIIIAEGFTGIIGKISHGIEKMNEVTSGALPDADAKLVVEALTAFVHVHQALLNVVIGKHGILALVPFFGPIRVSLVNLEAAIDTFAFDLIALIPTQAPAANDQFHSLSVTLTQAEDTYNPSSLSSEYSVTERILQGFKNVTDMSDNLRVATEKINIFNAAQEGFIIAQGFTVIIAKIAEGTTRVDAVSTGPLSDDDAQLVVEALTTFVHVHQALLNVVIGKHGIIALFPFFEPIRVALVSLEAVIDTFAFDLIGLIPTQAPAANDQFSSLSVTLTQAQGTYSLSSEYSVTERILQGFKNVTDMSDNLRVATEKINIFNAAQEGFIVAQGFTVIIAKIAEGTTRVDAVSTGPLSDDDAQLVVEALTTFVHVHQALLNVVIGKHGIIALFPFFEPIRVALVSLEAVIDTFAFDLIGLIPTQAPAANDQFSSLSVTLTQAQDTYSLSSEYSVTERILQGFQNVTDMSDNLRVATEKINVFNAAQQGFVIAQGFTVIIAKIAEGTTRVDAVSTGPLSDDDAKLVVEALTTFVHVHQALLNVVIGKHGIIALVPFFGPIRVALVNLEAVIDTFAFDLIGLIPTQAPAANTQFQSLSVTLTKAEDTYNLASNLASVVAVY